MARSWKKTQSNTWCS